MPVLLLTTFMGAGFESVGGQLLVCVAQAVFPVTVGIAIVRYRLYAIDVILNRAAVYGILTLVLGSAFVALTALSQNALQASTGQRSDLLPVGIGLGVAMTFQPLRR